MSWVKQMMHNSGIFYCNVIATVSDPALSMTTSDPMDRVDDQKDVLYASVQFVPNSKREADWSSSSSIVIEPQGRQPEEETVYATVKVSEGVSPVRLKTH
ncbi:hypothetical protein AALO_G00098490 [Alosa alosa]|uniref:Uncharacterized protein n=1 Tax=Alosa alosa TaxID=278164 RepID=A0AAV6GTE4_9TELE|nr:hypothetical protein AALO_G00098490 [Alosa alosa]